MSYDKYTWTTGETITANKLNHIEEGIAGSDCGYECVETVELLFDETVTTTSQGNFNPAQLTYPNEITAISLLVTFNGVEYDLERNDYNGVHCYGGASSTGLDFSNYPFAIMSSIYNDTVQNTIMTAEPGTYSVKAVANNVEVTDISSGFKAAVMASAQQSGSAATKPFFEVNFHNEDSGTVKANVKYAEVQAAEDAAMIIVGHYHYGSTLLTGVTFTSGMKSYQFDFVYFDRDLSKLFCDSMLLKYNDTVNKIHKEITTVSA